MRTEIPVCKRCCFCLPLRYGLLVWGYFRLILASLWLIRLTFTVAITLYVYRPILDIVLILVLLIVGISDTILSITFIIGCHKKSVKFMKSYYYYTIFLFVITLALTLCKLASTTYYALDYARISAVFWFYEDITIIVFYAGSQLYILLLLRSEMIKLNNSWGFRFVNHTADPECSLTPEGIIEENPEAKRNKAVDYDGEIAVNVS